MKTETYVETDHSEIFDWTEENFGISWNPCNDLFFRSGVLTYQEINKLCPTDFLHYTKYFYKKYKDMSMVSKVKASDITTEDLEAMSNTDKAWTLLFLFCEHHNVQNYLLVDCR